MNKSDRKHAIISSITCFIMSTVCLIMFKYSSYLLIDPSGTLLDYIPFLCLLTGTIFFILTGFFLVASIDDKGDNDNDPDTDY